MGIDSLLLIIVLALIFDFINGFHDAANSIATVVSTRVLAPFTAVLWAAAFNIIAFWIFKLSVADTVSKTVKVDFITLEVILAGLLAAIAWNLITWYYGIPSSSSHTLIGGFAGAAIAHAGFGSIQPDKVLKPIAFIVLAPLIGMIVSYFVAVITLHLCRRANPSRVDKIFRHLQLVSSAAYSLGHGGNDAQKVMGILMAAFIAFSHLPATELEGAPSWLMSFINDFGPREQEFKIAMAEYKDALAQGVQGLKKPELKFTDLIPSWVPISCYLAIGFGTMFGGWRIVKTMGQKVTKLTPFEGFAAETGGALTLFGTGSLGIPVSTTHTITGSIIGVGMLKRLSAVRWGVTINLVWAWIITIPVSAAMAGFFYWLVHLLT
jgi:inorganic phosphate transporter, PiT family